MFSAGFFEKDTDGVYKRISLKTLSGKKVVGIGDSLSQSGFYEQDFCKLSGAEYVGVYSAGGTFTPPDGGTSTQDRAKKFIESGKDADIILLENVNDGWSSFDSWGENPTIKGNIADLPFMLSQYINIDSPSASKEEASRYFKSNFESIISSVENKL